MEYDKVNGHATPGTTYHFVENREIYSEHVTLVCLWRGQTHGDTGRQPLLKKPLLKKPLLKKPNFSSNLGLC